MPIYEYKCSACSNRIEILQKINDPPLSVCDKCHGTMSKVISPAGLMFKGSGWYITDYSSKGKQSAGPSTTKTGQEKTTDKKEEKTAETAATTADKTETAT